MAIRMIAEVTRPTQSGNSTYQHILFVGEYPDDWSAARRRRRFKKLIAHITDPTLKVVEEIVSND